jgi:hypothetical protein
MGAHNDLVSNANRFATCDELLRVCDKAGLIHSSISYVVAVALVGLIRTMVCHPESLNTQDGVPLEKATVEKRQRVSGGQQKQSLRRQGAGREFSVKWWW